ncbi:ankyrin repeat domain-containing protein [Candidatus Micrarchaeota archaeon]|nr:ankyrin repeat domain-containing protein [Candidatus Micrarchaeota archaeon]
MDPNRDLFRAIERNDLDGVRSALAEGANPNARDESTRPRATLPLSSGDTPLITAAKLGRAEIAEELIRAGADVKARDRELGETALHWAVCAYLYPSIISELYLRTAELLIKHGADVNDRENEFGFSPLRLIFFPVFHADLYSFAELLIRNGADPDLRTLEGRKTPYHGGFPDWRSPRECNPRIINSILGKIEREKSISADPPRASDITREARKRGPIAQTKPTATTAKI